MPEGIRQTVSSISDRYTGDILTWTGEHPPTFATSAPAAPVHRNDPNSDLNMRSSRNLRSTGCGTASWPLICTGWNEQLHWTMDPLKIAIILGSTRPGRKGEAVAHWILKLARTRTDATFELVDVKDHELPLLDEPASPSQGIYIHAHTQRWSARIAAFDAFVFVTPEYNHSTCAALKNAIDYLNKEWANKAAGFVGYGAVGGVRAVEHLRQIMAELQVATVRAQVGLSLFTDFAEFEHFTPAEAHEQEVHTLLDQVIAWGTALRPLRTDQVVDDHHVLLEEGATQR